METRTIRKDIEALKSSLQFSQGEIDDVKEAAEVEKKKLEHFDDRLKYVETCTEEAYQLEKDLIILSRNKNILRTCPAEII